MVEEKKALKFKGTLILFSIALIVGAVYLFYFLPAAKEKKLIEGLSNRFFRVDMEQVEFLRIQNPRGVFDMVKKRKKWNIKSPIALPTDSETIPKILDIIKKGKIIKVITDDMKRAPEFGLNNPLAVLFIGYEGKIDELALGNINPSRTGIYAFTKGVNAIFLVDKKIAEALSIGLYELRSKALFTFHPETVTGIRIVRKKGEIELIKGQKGWQMVRPISGRTSEEEVTDFLLGVLNQRADEFYDDLIPNARDYRDTINLLFYSGEKLSNEIDVHYWGTGVNQGVVAYQKGMSYSGRLPRDFWNFINRDASYFRYRNLFDFDERDVSGIKVTKDLLAYELIRKGNEWQIGEKLVDRKKAMEFIWFLKAWKAERLMGPSTALNKDKPMLEISLNGKNGKVIGALRIYAKIEGEVLGYSREGTYELYNAISNNLKEICAISSLDLKKIPGKEEFVR